MFGQGQDAANPQSGFVYRHGTLYGTSYYGGSAFSGTIYKIDLFPTRESVVHNFNAATEGYNPFAGLTYRNGVFYGTTLQGGQVHRGTIFQIDARTGAYSTLSEFHGTPSKGGSYGELTPVNGWLFGTSPSGGSADAGTVFGYRISDRSVHTLYTFKGGTDGAYPYSGLVYLHGELYGTTAGGGADNNGTIFKVDPWTGRGNVLHRFDPAKDGHGPRSGLVYHRGRLYGTTPYGGGTGCQTIGCGTLYSYDPWARDFKVAYRFKGGSDGGTPYAPPTIFHGNLYGTTAAGGAGCGNGCGTIYVYDMVLKAEHVTYRLKELIDGQFPTAALTECAGALCGTTTSGSDSYNGTAFRFEP